MTLGWDRVRAKQDPRRRRIHLKTERFQYELEQSVQLEAISSTLPSDDLVEQIGLSQRDVFPEMNIQILKRHMEHMVPMQLSEETKVYAGVSGDAETVEVGRDVDRRAHWPVSITKVEACCQLRSS